MREPLPEVVNGSDPFLADQALKFCVGVPAVEGAVTRADSFCPMPMPNVLPALLFRVASLPLTAALPLQSVVLNFAQDTPEMSGPDVMKRTLPSVKPVVAVPETAPVAVTL